MPPLIRLYIVSIAIGFALAAAFVAALVAFDVAGIGHLILGSPAGAVALAMLVMFNGIVFSGVQFAIAVMRLGEHDNGPHHGGQRHRRLVPVAVGAVKRR